MAVFMHLYSARIAYYPVEGANSMLIESKYTCTIIFFVR